MPSMHFVSCRKDFWSATEFSSSDEIRELDLATGQGPTVTAPVFLGAMAGKRVVVLVHGYNNERLDVLASYGTIEERMRLLGFLGGTGVTYDTVVGFAWPGGATGVSFPFARLRAGESAERFARLLANLRGSNATVDLNTHSLGAHVAFEALRDAPGGTVRFAWNFAAAVDNESIEFDERYFEASQRCAKLYVFHSKNDPVLRVWYRIGDLFDFDTALGYSGPEDPRAIMDHSPNVRVVNCKEVVASHGGYRSSGEVWSYMATELVTPTTQQFTTLARTPATLTAVFRASGGPLRPARASATKAAGRPKRRRGRGRR